MVHAASATETDPEDESFDFEGNKELITLIARAPSRHPKLSAALFLLASAVGVVAALRVAPTYRAEAVLVVRKKAALPTFGETARNVPASDFDPAAGVTEVVKGRDTLLALVRQTHLTERMKWKAEEDRAPLTPDEKALILAKTLEEKLDVKSDGNTIAFIADWTDPQTAYDLVSAVVQNFLDNRNAAEVSIILDAIALLDEHAKTEREGIDAAMGEFIRTKELWRPAKSSTPAPAGVVAPRPPSESGIDANLAKRLEEKKQQIREIQDDRRRQLSELRTQMVGLLSTFTPSHPSVVALQRRLDALSEEPASLTALKNDERGLLSELAAATGSKVDAGRGAMLRGFVGGAASSSSGSSAPGSKQDLEIADPASAIALSKLQNRIHSYEAFMDQIGAARLQLDLARNAFKYRYGIYKPAEIPLSPRRPIHLMFLLGGVALGVFLVFGASGALDLASGRFIEPWQVKRKLSVPLLGEVMRP